MKKILLIAIASVMFYSVDAQYRWNIGVELGGTTNVSKYSGGDEGANALFNNQPFGTCNIAVNFRYRISKQLSFQSGFNFTEFGFQYTLAKDYSLLKPDEHYAQLRTSTCISSVPAMMIFNTKTNCSNTRFITGAGFTLAGIDNEWKSESSSEIKNEEGLNSKTTFMTEQSHSNTTMSASFTWMLGMEKVLKKGNLLDFTFRGNQGFETIAESTVHYTVNDKDYTHTFTNKGSYVVFAIAYYFQPMGSRKLNRTVSAPK